MPPKVVNALTAVLLLILAVALAIQTGLLAPYLSPGEYESTTITLQDENGTELGTVDARIADTRQKRYTGLSETESMAADEGMLFVHNREKTHGYVMRNMSFPLDILFVAENGTITRIHHAEREPGASGSELTTYRGRGKYVLEVNRGYTNRTGVDVGDIVVVPDDLS